MSLSGDHGEKLMGPSGGGRGLRHHREPSAPAVPRRVKALDLPATMNLAARRHRDHISRKGWTDRYVARFEPALVEPPETTPYGRLR